MANGKQIKGGIMGQQDGFADIITKAGKHNIQRWRTDHIGIGKAVNRGASRRDRPLRINFLIEDLACL